MYFNFICRNCNRNKFNIQFDDDDAEYCWDGILIKSKYVCLKVSRTTQTFYGICDSNHPQLKPKPVSPNVCLVLGTGWGGWSAACAVYLCCQTRGKRKFCNIFCKFVYKCFMCILCSGFMHAKNHFHSHFEHIKSVHFHRAHNINESTLN